MRAEEWLKGSKVCVTGGTGFLGSHLLPMLLQCGARVTCITRPQSDTSLFAPDIRIIHADLEDGSGLQEALRGQDILIHMAALLFGTGWQDYLRANSRVAQNVTRAMMAKNGPFPERIVLISSLAAAGPRALAPGVGEDALPAPVSAYGWSKLLCERIFMAHAGEKLVTLRPPIIYGSGDRGLLPVFRGVRRRLATSPGYRREFPFSIVHADDAARAILLCCLPEAAGVYHLSDGKIYNMNIFCGAMAQAMGARPPHMLHVPLSVLAASACLSSAFGMARQKTHALAHMRPPRLPQWNLDKYREAAQCGWLADSGRIRAHLGFDPQVSLEEGMAEAVAGYRARGWL